MKILIRIVAVLVLVVVLAVVAGLFLIDGLTASGIQKASAYATGVGTSLGSADLGLTSGTLQLDDLMIGNPSGYESDHFLSLGSGEIDVDMNTLTSDTVQVPLVVLKDVSIVIEKKDGKANYQAILEHLEKLGGDQPPREQPAEAGPGVNIKELRIENISATIKGYPFPIRPVNIPAIVLHDVPDGKQDAASVAEVVGVIIAATLEAVVGSVADLPLELAGGIGESLGDLGDLGTQAFRQLDGVAGETSRLIEGAGTDAAETVGEITEELGQTADQVEQGLKGLGGVFKKKDAERDGEGADENAGE